MAITFALRGTSKDAYYAGGFKTPTEIGTNSVDSGPGIGGSIINLDQGALGQHSLFYIGRGNLSGNRTMSILWRGAFGETGSNQTMISISSFGLIGRVVMRYTSTNTIAIAVGHDTTGATINTGTVAFTPSVGVYYDFVLVLDCSTTASGASINLYRDGTNILSPNNAIDVWSSPTKVNNRLIAIGADDSTTLLNTRTKIDEVVIWDSLITPTSVALTGGTGSLNGASRTQYVAVSNFEGFSYSDPGVANVRSGTGYTYTGLSKTGTAVIPTAANVRLGTAVDATTGTLDLPAESAVQSGVTYDNGTKTGTLDTAADANAVADAVWNRAMSSHTTAGTFGAFIQKLLTVGKFLGLK